MKITHPSYARQQHRHTPTSTRLYPPPPHTYPPHFKPTECNSTSTDEPPHPKGPLGKPPNALSCGSPGTQTAAPPRSVGRGVCCLWVLACGCVTATGGWRRAGSSTAGTAQGHVRCGLETPEKHNHATPKTSRHSNEHGGDAVTAAC